MHRSMKYLFRFIGLVAVVGIVAMAFSSGPSVSSPYLSSLSPLAIQPAYAAKCQNQTCQKSNRGGYICVTLNRASCKPNHQTLTCQAGNC